MLLTLLLILLKRRQPKHVVAYSTENGRVMVSRSAIVELVRSSCEQLEHVSKPNVRIRIKGGHTHFTVSLKLASGAQLRTIEQTLQAHLRRQLADSLGIENLGRINIIATGLKSGRIEPSSDNAEQSSQPSSAAKASHAEGEAEDTESTSG